jgi:hypothetical protein
MMLLAISFAPASASAATGAPIQCKTYDGYPNASATGRTAGRLCTYKAADYPGYKGYAKYGETGCGPQLPLDVDEEYPRDQIACAPPAPRNEWRWSVDGWVRDLMAQGTRTYVYPFSGSWRWAYQHNQWFAVQASTLTIYWFCPASGAACRSGL